MRKARGKRPVIPRASLVYMTREQIFSDQRLRTLTDIKILYLEMTGLRNSPSGAEKWEAHPRSSTEEKQGKNHGLIEATLDFPNREEFVYALAQRMLDLWG